MFVVFVYIVIFTTSNVVLSQSLCETPLKYNSFQALVSGNCDSVIKDLVSSNTPRCKKCMYIDSHDQKAIGFDFKLNDPDAKAVLASVGIDYDRMVTEAPTKFSEPCDCEKVLCLNQTQVEKIFDESIQEAIGNVRRAFPEFDGYSVFYY